MDLVRLRIPYAFVRERIILTWQDVMFGLREELLDPEALTDLACDELMRTGSSDPTLLELAALRRSDDPTDLVARLASRSTPQAETAIRERWLCLLLAWTYEHRAEYEDPFRRIEEIYADFGYPERLVGFVTFMPSGPPILGREAGEARMYSRWESYLTTEGARFKHFE